MCWGAWTELLIRSLLELVGGEKFLMDLYEDTEPVEELMDALYRKMDE